MEMGKRISYYVGEADLADLRLRDSNGDVCGYLSSEYTLWEYSEEDKERYERELTAPLRKKIKRLYRRIGQLEDQLAAAAAAAEKEQK